MRIREIGGDLIAVMCGFMASEKFLTTVASQFRPELVSPKFARVLAEWSIKYWNQYNEAPRHNIRKLFNSHLRANKVDDDTKAALEKTIDACEDSLEDGAAFNVQYAIDAANQMFKRTRIETLEEDIHAALLNGDLDAAEAAIADSEKLAIDNDNENNDLSPLDDEQEIYDAFENDTEPLFKYSGALGELLNDYLVRDSLIGIMAPEKRGKTFIVTDMVIRAKSAGRNVAYFQCGDMSKSQVMRRIHGQVAGRPVPLHHEKSKPFQSLKPVLDCRHNQTNACKEANRVCAVGLSADKDFTPTVSDFHAAPPDYKPCTYCLHHCPWKYAGAVWYEEATIKPIGWREAYKNGKLLASQTRGSLRLSVHPNDTINFAGIDRKLKLWRTRYGFVPDVIGVDYADILAPEDSKVNDERHRINKTWKAARRLSQEWHALVILPTQTDTGSYTAEIIRATNFSEDKRKHSHVTGMLAINKTDEDRRRMLMRVGWVMLREGGFDVQRTASVLHWLESFRPINDSFWSTK